MTHQPSATRRQLTLLLPASAALSACAGGLWPSPTPLPTRYTWAIPSPMVEHLQPGRPVLLLAPPTAATELQGTDLLYLGPNSALLPYARSSWSAPPAQALAALLQPALAASGAFAAVLLSPSAARPGLRLETHLGRLQHEPGSGEMVVHLNAVLINLTTRQPLGSRSFALRQPVDQAQAASAVAAAQALGHRLAAEVAQWCAGLL
jgi:cholesterol transport system auxiliary component